MLRKLIQDLISARRLSTRGTLSSSRRHPSQYDAQSINRPTGQSLQELVRDAETLIKAGRLLAGLQCYQAALRAFPKGLDAYVGMANVLVDLWCMEEAVEAYGNALQLAPYSSRIFSALLFHLHYLPWVDRKWMFDLHQRYGSMMRSRSPTSRQTYGQNADPDRRIRVGYLSPNFSKHSVGYFIEPILREHDRKCCEVYCYNNHRLADETTRRIRDIADGWREIADENDDSVEEMIRNDRIDILVDLVGHSKDNRLAVFARRPAPIQITWLGYPDTTGLDTVDYRITDSIADPPPEAEEYHSERLLRMKECFLCYQPPADGPPVNLSRDHAGDVVFSSFNNLAKLNEDTIRLWGHVLEAVPGSRLLLKSASLSSPDSVDRVLECFERNGIVPDRVELHRWLQGRSEHLALYDKVDIALDTFPYNGTTTTCEALWMGVPVISLSGNVHMSRVGATILRCVGLADFIAETPQQYVEIAVALARNRARRESMRATLRNMVASSVLLAHKGFTEKLESHYRQSWGVWCASNNGA